MTAILGIIAMIITFAIFAGVVKFLWNAIQLVMKYDTFYAVILYMQDNKWAMFFGILFVGIVIAVIYDKINERPDDYEKDMDFARKFDCWWVARKLDDLLENDGKISEDERFIWFDSNDNRNNFFRNHVNKIAYRIVFREDQWMVQPIEITYSDETKNSYRIHYVNNYYEIPTNAKTIYDIDGINPLVNDTKNVVINQKQTGGDNSTQIQIGIMNNYPERKEDKDD